MADLAYLQDLEKLVVSSSVDIFEQYSRRTTATKKADGSLVTEADLTLQEKLTFALKELSPEYKLLGEEMTPQQQRDVSNTNDGYWCLDPLDGTNNFHHGVPLYAISLALVINEEIRLGVIYDPVRNEIFSALKGSGLRVNGKAVIKPDQPERLNECLASVDFKRLNHTIRKKVVTAMPFKSQRNIGSCALEWAWLAAGRTQLILHGEEKFWDYAAGVLLLQESGGLSCTLDGENIFNNTITGRSVVAATNAQLHQQWESFLTSPAVNRNT